MLQFKMTANQSSCSLNNKILDTRLSQIQDRDVQEHKHCRSTGKMMMKVSITQKMTASWENPRESPEKAAE